MVGNYILTIIGPSSIPGIVSIPYPPQKKPKVQFRKGKEKAINSNPKNEAPLITTITIIERKLEVLISRIRIILTVLNDLLDSSSYKSSNRNKEEEEELDIII